MLITDIFSYCCEIKDFSQSPTFSWWAGVQQLGGSTARQIAKMASGNIPYHGHHAQFRNRGWPGGRKLWALLVFQEFRGFFCITFVKFSNSHLASYDCCSGTDCRSVIWHWENWVIYSLFCVFIAISIISSTSFVALLNCLYLNTWVSPFVLFFSPTCWGEGEGWANSCGVLAARTNHDKGLLKEIW